MHTVEQYLNKIEGAIDLLPLNKMQPQGLYKPIVYGLEAGGKRLRPVLTLASCEACGGAVEQALPAAVAVEMFHNFTLLHDDIMDKSPVRRGRPTVYVKWDEATAILSGDAMLTYAGMELSKTDSPLFKQMHILFNQTAMAVYEGQAYDMEFETRDDVTVNDYFCMIEGKTSSLIGCACALGTLSAGREDYEEAFFKYGFYLGTAFQLMDDYLDTFGQPETFGKPIGGDIVNRKKTWLWIKADAQGALSPIYNGAQSDGQLIDNVRNCYVKLGLDEQIRKLISVYTSKAIVSLPETLTAERRGFFEDYAYSLVKRCK